MKLTVLDGHGLNPGDLTWDGIKELTDSFTLYDRTPANQVAERIGDSDAILLNKVNITEEILSACPRLKYIGVLATGYNVIDLEACRKRGIIVTNIPKYSTDAVAQHVFAYILHFTNMVASHNESVQKGDWISCPDFCFWHSPLTELAGKTMGILGYGAIGSKTAKIAEAFGMKVICYTRTKKDGMPPLLSLDEVLSQSDFISIHMPLTSETKYLMNSETLSKMKKTAILINTARGDLVNEQDVADALKNGKIAGYAADVLSAEPMSKDNPLSKAPNCIITPHLAWAPLETRQRLLNIAINNLKAYKEGRTENCVL